MTVKTALLTLLLTGFGLWAQTPPFAPLSRAPGGRRPRRLGTNRDQPSSRPCARHGRRHQCGRPGSPLGQPGQSPCGHELARASAGLAKHAASAAGGKAWPPRCPQRSSRVGCAGLPWRLPGRCRRASPPTNAVTPAPAATNSPLEEPLPQGMIDFRSADLTQVLDIYSMMVNRTILRPATLPAPTITLTTRGQLTVREGIQALEAVLAFNGITMVNMGDKFVKAMPEAQGNTAGARFDTNSAAQLPEMGQYVTHVVQLKYAKPSEMVAVLQPFVKIPNAILPIDSSQILVLRDYTENVKRMLELIKEIDVAIPSEFVSEVIPIKYAKASDIASALNSLSSGGGGTSVGGGGATGTRSSRTTGMNRTGGMGGMGVSGANHARDGHPARRSRPTPHRGGRQLVLVTAAEHHQRASAHRRDSGAGPDQDHLGRAHQLAADLRREGRHEDDQGDRRQAGRGAGAGAD